MTSFEYSKDIVSKNDLIFIDTSSLMDYKGLSLLVESLKGDLVAIDKKIIVPKVVWLELMRHRHSANEEKQDKVNKAITIIEENLDIFFLDNSDMNNEDMYSAFADAELLSQLIKHKPESRQLLITNDKRLSSDAFKLNKQESCFGKYISVCYITDDGYLNRCKVVGESTEQKPIVKEIIKEVPVEVHATEEKQNDSHVLEVVLVSASTLSFGYLIGKYGDKILNTIKNAF